MAYPGSTYDVSAEGKGLSMLFLAVHAYVIAAADATSLIADSADRPKMWKVPKKETPMYQYQSSLPSLPIPTLEQTCVKYLRSVRPLLTDEEFSRTSSNVTNFLLDGSGKKFTCSFAQMRDC